MDTTRYFCKRARRGTLASGFTIVELLIVIVVIAILVAISSVVYGGISKKASNTAIVNAASESSRLIRSYISVYGVYPYVVPSNSVTFCISNESGCINSLGQPIGSNTIFNAEIAKVGTTPQSVPHSGSEGNGIVYQYVPGIVVGGVSQPLGLVYWLQGQDQDCGLPGVIDRYNLADKTRCKVVVPGPSHI